MLKKISLTVLALAMMGGVAYAASANWGGMESDLIRCANTASGNDCGKKMKGTDSLEEGEVKVRKSSIRLELDGAAADTKYTLYFVKLTNSKDHPDSNNAYTGSKKKIGTLTTDEDGDARKTFKKKASSSARLGYFLIEDESGYRQFVSGIDQ